ncbi:MAG: flagellar type III secretion system pore protein FliP [Christensenellales bacterium]
MNNKNSKRPARSRRRTIKKMVITSVMLIALIFLFSGCAADTDTSSENPMLGGLLGDRAQTVDILLLLTILSLLPSILIMLTCFPRIIIVLSLIRNGLGLQQMPPNQVLIGLALFLTFFVMSPVIEDINVNAYQPYAAEQIESEEALERAMEPVRDFMFRQTYKSDLDYFVSISPSDKTVQSPEQVSNTALIPAFITSEIKRGFQIGFLLYIPFIVLDMIVASALMSMGMMMLPPIIISLPFKVLLFVLVDGWTLTVRTLINSFA